MEKVVGHHEALGLRFIFDAGITDAARAALSVVCAGNCELLDNSAFKHYPCRANGSSSTEIEPADILDSRMSATVALLAAFSTDLDGYGMELHTTTHRLSEAEDRIRVLEAQLQGGEVDPREDRYNRPDRPPPRKLYRYGSPSSITRVRYD